MTLIQDPNPIQEPLFTLAPPPTPPKPERKKLAGWHLAVLIVGVPILAFLSCVGANTVVNWWLVDAPPAHASATASHEPTPHKSKPAAPKYDLAGYRSATTGARQQAFVSALGKLRADNQQSDFATALSDAPNLVNAADRWLRQLRHTNPPPSYRGAKATYVMAATIARQAGQTTLSGLQTTNLGLLQQGAAMADKAVSVLSRATATAPRGS